MVVRSFKKKNIDIKTGVKVLGHTPNGSGGTTVHFGADDGDVQNLEVDAVVVSIGRRPFADQLGLQGTAVVGQRSRLRRGRRVLPHRRARRVRHRRPHQHPGARPRRATPRPSWSPSTSSARSRCRSRYDRVPWAIYCHPEVAFAGPSEEAAREAGHDVVVAKHQFRANSRAQILGELDGLVKIIAKKNADGSAGQILGVHMVGPWVTEQLSGGYLAVNWEATWPRSPSSSSPTPASPNCSARPCSRSPAAA